MTSELIARHLSGHATCNHSWPGRGACSRANMTGSMQGPRPRAGDQVKSSTPRSVLPRVVLTTVGLTIAAVVLVLFSQLAPDVAVFGASVGAWTVFLSLCVFSKIICGGIAALLGRTLRRIHVVLFRGENYTQALVWGEVGHNCAYVLWAISVYALWEGVLRAWNPFPAHAADGTVLQLTNTWWMVGLLSGNIVFGALNVAANTFVAKLRYGVGISG